MLVFACISPHPPILLPTVGSPEDRQLVKNTISSLESLAPKLAAAKPDIIIVSSPHQDWGVEVPLHFLMSKINPPAGGQKSKLRLKIQNYQSADSFSFENSQLDNSQLVTCPLLTTLDSPKQHYEWGKQVARSLSRATRVAWIASGDMSHTLKPDGPYGFNAAGPEYDKKFIQLLKKKDVQGILNLDSDPDWLESAGQCGLNSFCMLLGALDWQTRLAGLKPSLAWSPEILSYEGPFGVGYLVARFKIVV